MPGFGYGFGYGLGAREGGAADPFVGELDHLDNLYSIGADKRVLKAWAGATHRLRRTSDNAEQDFAPGADGWLDIAAVLAWRNAAGAAVARVVTRYDQTGNGRHHTQSTALRQPILDFAGARPVTRFESASTHFHSIANAAGFARNIGAVSLVAVRRHADANSTQFLYVSTNTAGYTRISLNQSPNFNANGRRLDADGSQNTTGYAVNTNWGVAIARADWGNARLHHRVESQSETRNPFQTAGVTANTDSLHVTVGSANGSGNFNGSMSLAALVRDLITDQEDADLITQLAGLKL